MVVGGRSINLSILDFKLLFRIEFVVIDGL